MTFDDPEDRSEGEDRHGEPVTRLEGPLRWSLNQGLLGTASIAVGAPLP